MGGLRFCENELVQPMSLAEYKNPPLLLLQACRYWWAMRHHPRAFTLNDALMGWRDLLLPERFSYRRSLECLAREARIERVGERIHKVTVVDQDLHFFWLGTPENGLHASIAQEFDPGIAHCYTTPPVKLSPRSLILDVGACEGLFAFRVVRQGLAGKVICFEPSKRTAEYLARAAQSNKVDDHIVVECLAVLRKSGRVKFIESDSPEANRVDSTSAGDNGQSVPAVSIDDYCAEKGIQLTSQDLIKIDAEGSDLEVLQGAEKMIRSGSPQIAVTTYHKESHAFEIAAYLKSVQPAYRLRVKGMIVFGQPRFWDGPRPRPVLLQATV